MISTRFAIRHTVTMLTVLFTVACSRDLPTEAADLEIRAAKGGPAGGSGSTKPSGIVVGTAIPNAAKRGMTTNVRIIGSGFDRNLVARWAIDSVVTSDVVVNSTRYISSTEMVANITVSPTAELTEYDIILTSTKGGKPGIGTEIFEVVEELPLTGLGGAYSLAYAINETGLIAGSATYWVDRQNSSTDRPVVWENGVVRDLMPAGYSMGRALDVNEAGQVVGWVVAAPNTLLPFVWTSGTGLRILPVPPGAVDNGAMAINDAGVIVGWSGRSAVRWVNGVMEVLRNVPDQWSTPVDVNNNGAVVGYYGPTINGEPEFAWIWTPEGGPQALPTLVGNSGSPVGINDRGQIIGVGPSPVTGQDVSFIRENGVTRPFSSAAFPGAAVRAISELGHVVAALPDGRAIMRQPDGSESVICNPVTPTATELTRCGVHGVNSAGHAVGLKTDKYGYAYKAYRWVPML